jgi:hypothetical protein
VVGCDLSVSIVRRCHGHLRGRVVQPTVLLEDLLGVLLKERPMVLASLFLKMSTPRINLASTKSVMRNCSPIAGFADSIHMSKSETMKLASTYTSTMHMPRTEWFIV